MALIPLSNPIPGGMAPYHKAGAFIGTDFPGAVIGATGHDTLNGVLYIKTAPATWVVVGTQA